MHLEHKQLPTRNLLLQHPSWTHGVMEAFFILHLRAMFHGTCSMQNASMQQMSMSRSSWTHGLLHGHMDAWTHFSFCIYGPCSRIFMEALTHFSFCIYGTCSTVHAPCKMCPCKTCPCQDFHGSMLIKRTNFTLCIQHPLDEVRVGSFYFFKLKRGVIAPGACPVIGSSVTPLTAGNMVS